MNFSTQIATAPNSPCERRHGLALRLLRCQGSALGGRGLVLGSAVMAAGLVALLPAQVLRMIAQGSPEGGGAIPDTVAIGIGLLAVVQGTSSLTQTLGLQWLRERVASDLRRKVLWRLHEAILPGRHRSEEWRQRITRDLARTEAFLTESLPRQLRDLVIAVGAAALWWFHDGLPALLPLTAAGILAVASAKVRGGMAASLRVMRARQKNSLGLLVENLQGARAIRSQRGEPFHQRRFDSRLGETASQDASGAKNLSALRMAEQWLSPWMVTLCLSVAAWRSHPGPLGLYPLLLYPFLIARFYIAARNLTAAAAGWGRFLRFGTRLGEVIFGAAEFTCQRRVIATDTDFQSAHTLRLTGVELGPPGQNPVGPVDLRLSRGEVWSIGGPSGSGKSAFLEVLAGLRPALRGKARVESAAGLPLWESAEETELQLPVELCAYVEHPAYLFEGSLRENLTFGNPHRLSDAVLWEQIERAGLYSAVRGNGGLDQVLREKAGSFSEGERYRLALCRALLLERPFLLLDEPFAGLDERSATAVRDLLETYRHLAGIVLVTRSLPEGFRLEGMLNFESAHPQPLPVGERSGGPLAAQPGRASYEMH